MAKTKKIANAVVSRGLEHGDRASGAKYVRRGFAIAPELDLAFALGHGGQGIGPMKLLPDIDPSKKPKFGSEMAHNVVVAYVRKEDVAADPRPIDEDEADKLAGALVGRIELPWMFLGLEAIASPSRVLASMTRAIETAPERCWNNGGWGALCGPLKGMMLRVPEAEAKAARERLEPAWKKWSHVHGSLTFDILLHGREGIERSGYKYIAAQRSYGRAPGRTDAPASARELLLLDPDEAAFVADQHRMLWEAFKWKTEAHMLSPTQARTFFLGGKKTFETELRALEGYSGAKQVEAFAAYEQLNGPIVAKLMEKLAKPGGKVEKRARAWLEQFAR